MFSQNNSIIKLFLKISSSFLILDTVKIGSKYWIFLVINNFKNVTEVLENNSVHYDELGTVGKKELIINDKSKVTIDDLIKSHTNWLTKYMSK